MFKKHTNVHAYMRTDHHKISQTAVMCAEARAEYTDMPYANQIFSELPHFMDGKIRSIIPAWINFFIHKIPAFRSGISVLEGRYVSTNAAIDKLGIGVPVLELASGLSTRGLHLAGEHEIYLETDLEDILSQKEEITKRIREKEGRNILPNHKFKILNALDYGQLQSAGQALRQGGSARPIAVIHEGLSMYLDDQEQRNLRDNLQKFLTEYSPDGAWITPDFSYVDMNYQNRLMKFIKRRLAKKTGRPFNNFANDKEVKNFLKEGGLKVDFIPNKFINVNLSCIGKMNLKVKNVLKYAENYRVAFITLE